MGRTNSTTFNKHASVHTRTTFNGKIRTETTRRDDTLSIAASTVPRDNSSRLYIDTDSGTLVMDGRGMRTLMRVLMNHFTATDKNFP